MHAWESSSEKRERERYLIVGNLGHLEIQHLFLLTGWGCYWRGVVLYFFSKERGISSCITLWMELFLFSSPSLSLFLVILSLIPSSFVGRRIGRREEQDPECTFLSSQAYKLLHHDHHCRSQYIRSVLFVSLLMITAVSGCFFILNPMCVPHALWS